MNLASNNPLYLYKYNFEFQLILLTIYFLVENVWIKRIALFYFIFNFFFFRNYFDSSNLSNLDKGVIISPSDSKVIKIERTKDFNFIKTYLSPLDRHFMVAPTDCHVLKVQDITDKSSNAEHIRVTFRDEFNKIFHLDQIVSQVGEGGHLLKIIYPNRCVTFVKPGQFLKRGERYGLIRYGSNMEYRFPHDYNLDLKLKTHYRLGVPIGKIN